MEKIVTTAQDKVFRSPYHDHTNTYTNRNPVESSFSLAHTIASLATNFDFLVLFLEGEGIFHSRLLLGNNLASM